jgi:hypothetical protein
VSTSAPDAAGVDAPSSDGEPVGSIAEEAFKLFRAMAPGGAGADHQGADHEASDHVCSTGWCPVCQVVGFVRDHPETIASVTQSAAGLARSLRDLVDAAMTPQPSQEDQ